MAVNKHPDFNGSYLAEVVIANVVIPEYQRRLRPLRVEAMTKGWDPNLFEMPRVALRADGAMISVDGHHRMAACTARGHVTVPAIVTPGLTDTEIARLFWMAQAVRYPLTPFEAYAPSVASGEPWAVALAQIVAKYGLVLSAHASGPLTLACVSRCRRVIAQGGVETLDDTIGILCEAYPPNLDENERRLGGNAVLGMADLIRKTKDAGLFDRDLFVAKLKAATFRDGEVEGIRITPANMAVYVASLYARGRATAMPFGGAAMTQVFGKAFAFAILGSDVAHRLYPRGA